MYVSNRLEITKGIIGGWVARAKASEGPIKGQVLTEEMYNQLLDDYYDYRGWDYNCVVTDENTSVR